MASKTDQARQWVRTFSRKSADGGSTQWAMLRYRECQLLRECRQDIPALNDMFGTAIDYVLSKRPGGFDHPLAALTNFRVSKLPDRFKERVAEFHGGSADVGKPSETGDSDGGTPPTTDTDSSAESQSESSMPNIDWDAPVDPTDVEAMEQRAKQMQEMLEAAKAAAEQAKAEAEAKAAAEAAAAEAAENSVFKRAQRMIDDAVADGKISNPHGQLTEALACVLAFGRAYLAGPSGTGKSYAGEQIAAVLGREFVLQGYDASTFPERLHGYMDANGNWVEGKLSDAYHNGKVYIGDEMDKAETATTASTNQHVNFNDTIATAGGDINRHDDFVFIATGNSAMDGPGGQDGVYATERQSADFIARWEQLGVMIHFDYDEQMETNMLGQFASEYPLLLQARKNIKSEDVSASRTIQTRTMQGWTTWRGNGLSIGETVGRICRLWNETEVRKVWKHLDSADLETAVGMLGSW